MDEQTARRDICRIGQLLYERSYVVSSDGNVSVRLDDGRIVATPTMICKGRMTEDSLAITDASGKALTQRKPSSELAMHLLIYQERPDVKAVCHAHPPHGTAFAVAGLPIDQPILSEVILNALNRRTNRSNAAVGETSQRIADGEPRRGGLRFRSLASVRSAGDTGTHGAHCDSRANARGLEEFTRGRY